MRLVVPGSIRSAFRTQAPWTPPWREAVNTESDKMAGSGKKEQKLASNESAQAGATPLVVQDPVVSAFVMPGAPPGLIPRVKLDTDQKTTIATWNGSLPTNPARKEFFRLQIARPGPEPEWETLQEHEYAGRASPVWAPLDFTIPSTFFLNEKNEGAFILRYEHENQIGATDHRKNPGWTTFTIASRLDVTLRQLRHHYSRLGANTERAGL